MIPRARTAPELAAALPILDEERVGRLRAEAAERPIHYPLGSGEAEEVALLAGLKPAIRQLFRPEAIAEARARFTRLGLAVEEVDGLVHASTSSTKARFVRGVVLVVGRDPARVRAIAAREQEQVEVRASPAAMAAEIDPTARVIEQGRELGYPRCCTEAFAALPSRAGNPAAHRAAVARTVEAPIPRLNTLDLLVFHYVPWVPCRLDCPISARYADAVAARIAARHPRFVEAIDAALGAHRLLALEDVQISIEGRWDGRGVIALRAWPTARDRHPSAPLSPKAIEAAARLAAIVEAAGSVEIDDGVILAGGRPLVRTPEALLAPFGPR
jgi:hypothetical protein